jgi:ABC-type lipoprotein release transport system permease subunit
VSRGHASRLVGLVAGNLRRNLRGLFASAFGVALGVGCLVFFLALGRGLDGAVAKLFPASARELEVVLPALPLSDLFGAGRKLDDATVAQLAAIPGVDRVFPKMQLRFPMVTRYSGLFFGKELHMALEIVGVGVPPELIGADAHLPFVDPGPGSGPAPAVAAESSAPIPIVANGRVLELYNKIFAPNRNLPRVSQQMISGFTFPVELGRSWVAAKNMPLTIPTSFQVAGFSDQAMLAGVSVPLETARRLNRFFGQEAEAYSSVLVRARSPDAVPQVAARIKELGLELDESDRTRALQIGAAVRIGALALSLLSGLVVLLSAVNIAQAFHAQVRERRKELGILRAVGATQRAVQRIVLAEAGATGLLGGAAGVLAAALLGALVDHLLRTRLPDFPFKPDRLVALEPWMAFAGLAVGLCAALGGAWLPAREAARVDPARALSGE